MPDEATGQKQAYITYDHPDYASFAVEVFNGEYFESAKIFSCYLLYCCLVFVNSLCEISVSSVVFIADWKFEFLNFTYFEKSLFKFGCFHL